MVAPPAEIVRTDDGGTAMVLRRRYPDPVEEVWAAVTESERLGRWIGTWTGEPREGGTVSFTMTGEVDAGGEVDEPTEVAIRVCDPPRRLVVDLPVGDGGDSWHLDLTVEPDGDGAVLVFAQSLPDGERNPDVEAGWNWYLDRLTASLHGGPMPSWDDYAPES
ncbi:SRPBCC family protein [Actinomycetospora atypica]|uniref:SRPBCC family protein n=1 Tax=Actinomycetospora atypica TaxID=1290095 RepID=A0ABV9YIX7_9PSEU